MVMYMKCSYLLTKMHIGWANLIDKVTKACTLIKSCQYLTVFTGAGISTSAGISGEERERGLKSDGLLVRAKGEGEGEE